MKITIEMACSINGLIADRNSKEDFLLYRNWKIMLELLKKQDVLIFGKTTFDSVMTWGEKYVKALKDINVIVMSRSELNQNSDNVFYCKSVEDCINLCKLKKFNKLFISGGATTNNLFMEKGIVDFIILNYSPYILNEGLPLFKGAYFENKLELIKIVKEKEGIVQVHYRVIK